MINKFGLFDTDIEFIVSVLKKQPKVDSACIFGSRAKGNFCKGSDVDIALKGAELNLEIINQLSYWLNEESRMPYKFDVLNYDRISESALKKHIDRVGIEIYNK